MKEKLNKKEFFAVSLMLFGMFFGAGNLIFPPLVGKMAGHMVWQAMAYFGITAVILPILGVVAVSKSGGLKNLAKRVDPIFANVFTIIIYLSIGPLLGIPRAGSLPFEFAIRPYLSESLKPNLALLVFTLVFFALAYWISLSPNKLVERIGKILSPVLVALIVFLFIIALKNGLPSLGETLDPAYNSLGGIQGFIDGYLTMDTIAALNFGLVISVVIKNFNIKEEKKIIKTTIKTGFCAGLILMIIYLILSFLGAATASLFPNTQDGAEILSEISSYLLGRSGSVILAAIFTLACLTTSVGLLSSLSEYFTREFKIMSYKNWLRLWTLWSFAFANIGLRGLLKVNLIFLYAIYPVAITLIILSLLEKLVGRSQIVYRPTVYLSVLIGTVSSINAAGFQIPFISNLVKLLPLYEKQLAWLLPVIIMIMLSSFISRLKERNLLKKEICIKRS